MKNDALNRALSSVADEEFLNISDELPWEISTEFQDDIRVLVKSLKKPVRLVRRLLIAAAVITLCSVTVVFGVAGVRERVIGFFTERYNNHTDIIYGYDEPGDISIEGVIADKYTLNLSSEWKQTTYNNAGQSITTVWENSDGNSIMLEQGSGITQTTVDNSRLTEHDFVESGVTYKTFSEDGYVLLMWNTDKYTFSIDYYGDMPPTQLKDMILNSIGSESVEVTEGAE